MQRHGSGLPVVLAYQSRGSILLCLSFHLHLDKTGGPAGHIFLGLAVMAKIKKPKAESNNRPKHQASPSSKISKPTKKQPQKASTKKPRVQAPTIPFSQEDCILLIGEGDFSFAKSLVEEHGCYDITATCLDSRPELYEKYTPQAEEHTTFLETEGHTVLYSVDATKLDTHKTLKKSAHFDRIIFNFPHIGGKSKDVNRQVRANQELLVAFFTTSLALLAADGAIVVTIFEGEPYTLWNLRDLARHAGLAVERSFRFVWEAYPGYRHARTLGNLEGRGGWKGEEREARSFVLRRKEGSTAGKG